MPADEFEIRVGFFIYRLILLRTEDDGLINLILQEIFRIMRRKSQLQRTDACKDVLVLSYVHFHIGCIDVSDGMVVFLSKQGQFLQGFRVQRIGINHLSFMNNILAIERDIRIDSQLFTQFLEHIGAPSGRNSHIMAPPLQFGNGFPGGSGYYLVIIINRTVNIKKNRFFRHGFSILLAFSLDLSCQNCRCLLQAMQAFISRPVNFLKIGDTQKSSGPRQPP
ncbi:hypothetical protein D3C75_879280 [compost metagenome]